MASLLRAGRDRRKKPAGSRRPRPSWARFLLGIGVSGIGAIGVKALPIATPRRDPPRAVLRLLVRQVASFVRAPVEQGDVEDRRRFRLDGNGQRGAVGGPVRVGFGGFGSPRKVNGRSAQGRDGE